MLLIFGRIVYALKVVNILTENLAQEIRNQEDMANSIIADAKAKAAEIAANAQNEAERSMKITRQLCHRQLRESIADVEKEAEVKAAEILQKGQSDAKEFYEQNKNLTGGVADWLVREVISTYGSCRDD